MAEHPPTESASALMDSFAIVGMPPIKSITHTRQIELMVL